MSDNNPLSYDRRAPINYSVPDPGYPPIRDHDVAVDPVLEPYNPLPTVSPTLARCLRLLAFMACAFAAGVLYARVMR